MPLQEDLKAIGDLDERFENGVFETQGRRSRWKATVKQVIVPALNKVKQCLPKSETRRSLYVAEWKLCDGMEAVSLHFGTMANGLVSHPSLNSSTSGYETGAELTFCLTNNAQVVTVSLAFLDHLPGGPAPDNRVRHLGPVYTDPALITEEKVVAIAREFLTWALSRTSFLPNDPKSVAFTSQMFIPAHQVDDLFDNADLPSHKDSIGFVKRKGAQSSNP